MSELVGKYAFLIPDARDPFEEFREIFVELYPARPFDGVFYEHDLEFLRNETVGPNFGRPAESLVQQVSVAVNERRRAVAAEKVNEKEGAGFGVYGRFSKPHAREITSRVTACAHVDIDAIALSGALPQTDPRSLGPVNPRGEGAVQ